MNWKFWFPSIGDISIIIVTAFIWTLARIRIQAFFKNLGTSLNVPEVRKFSESGWKVTIYTFLFIGEVIIVAKEDFFPNTENCWRGWPNIVLSPMMKYFYLVQLGFYIHSAYTHVAFEVKRSDWWPLMLHHLVTIWLIYFSYSARFAKIGILVLMCHDVNDIFLEAGKLTVYTKIKRGQTVLFVLGIMGSWLVSRLSIYPLMVIYSSSFESACHVAVDIFPFWFGFNVSLTFLLCLHIYWFGLMIKVAYRVSSGNEYDDPREKEKAKQNQLGHQQADELQPVQEGKTQTETKNADNK